MTSSVTTRMPRRCASFRKRLEIGERAVARIDGRVIGDVVAVVAQRRRIERQQPEDVDAEVLQIVELPRQTLKIADAVAVAVEERPDVRLVDDPVFVPEVVVMRSVRSECAVGGAPPHSSPSLTGNTRNLAPSGPAGGSGRCARGRRAGSAARNSASRATVARAAEQVVHLEGAVAGRAAERVAGRDRSSRRACCAGSRLTTTMIDVVVRAVLL